MAILVLVLAILPHSADADVKVSDQTVTVSAGDMRLTLARENGQPSVGGLSVTEGTDASPIRFGNAQEWKHTADTASFHLQEKEGGLAVAMNVAADDALRIKLLFRNVGKTQRLLQVAYAIPVPGNEPTWWDGRWQRDPAPVTFDSMSGYLRLPISVAWNQGHGVAVGVDPLHLLSTFATGAVPIRDGLLVRFATRIVLDPGQSIELPLCAFAFRPTFGHLDAVQRYYELYPAAFSVQPGIRPSLIGGGGYLMSRRLTRSLQWEQSRRFGMGWEWAYCPAQIPGDWYADERFYDPARKYAGDVDRHVNVVKGTLADYRQDMRERFQRGWWATNLAFYMLPQYADKVVQKGFPDGVIVDGKGQNPKEFSWVKPDSVGSLVYPWGNGYGREVVREIGQIASDFGPSAIAFDEAYGADKHYGAGIEMEPARSWDADGVYASTQIALARLGAVIHATKVRGYNMACIFNKPGTYNTAVRCDVAMHEMPPYERTDEVEPRRLLMGHKPMSWWSPLKAEKILRWEELTPVQIRKGLLGLYANVRLSGLRYGAFPMGHQVFGIRPMVELMPVMTELLREGWQPVPATEGHPDLWLSRYGRGVKTFLVLGNPKREQRPGNLRLHTRYLGSGHFLFSDYRGKPLKTRSSAGFTELDLGMLGMHEHRIARALVQLKPEAEIKVTGSAQRTWQPLREGVVQATWRMERASVGTIVIRIPRGATPRKLKINGTACGFRAVDDTVRHHGELPAIGTLHLSYRPRVRVNTSPEDICAFPFVVDGKSETSVVLPQTPTAHDHYLAEHLSIYFDYWTRRQAIPDSSCSGLTKAPAGPVLPIVEGGATVPTKSQVIFVVQEEGASVSLAADGRTLKIAGPLPSDREAAMRRLFEILDQRYPFHGALGTSPLYHKIKLSGKALE
ncbi:MAG: hypothetical protein KAI66_09440 [Lentisphaeria bacterium]|nr:hypothetical protein [Lentisphaeria bacterium]